MKGRILGISHFVYIFFITFAQYSPILKRLVIAKHIIDWVEHVFKCHWYSVRCRQFFLIGYYLNHIS